MLKTILKYLRRTKDQFLTNWGSKVKLKGYVGFQKDIDEAKFSLGYVFTLNGGVVSWKSSKQGNIADSTTEAGYIAASEATKEAIWMKIS